MKTIKIRIDRLALANSLALILTIILVFKEVFVGTMHVAPILIAAVILFLILSGLLVREYGRHKNAKLIMENEIMHIKVAEIEGETFKPTADAGFYR